MPRTWRAPLCLGALLLALVADGCAMFRCAPLQIVVAEREPREFLREKNYGIRTDAFGHAYELKRMEMVPEYWVRSQDGKWYEVSRDLYRVATPGRAIDVCE
jgi:hypothetical protein